MAGLNFFIDNMVSYRIAHALDDLCAFDDNTVEPLRQNFAQSTPDTVWIPELANRERPPIVISGDCKITRRKGEQEVFRRARLTTFFLSSGLCGCKFWDQSHRLVKRWPEITALAETMARGSLFVIPHRLDGKFSSL